MVSLNIGTTEQYMDAGGYSTAIYEHGLISIPCNCSLCIRLHLRGDGEQAWPSRGSLDYGTVYCIGGRFCAADVSIFLRLVIPGLGQERQERFAHDHSFLKSNESESLTVAL